MACYVTGYLLLIEIHRGKEGTNKRKFHLELGVTEACTKRRIEATKGLCQRDTKGDMKDCFIFHIWFSSKKLEETEMDFGTDMIGMVKTNKKKYTKRPLRILQRIGR